MRVVLDTNVLVSALVFGGAMGSRMRATWINRTVVPVVSRSTTDELVRVLGYPAFRLSPDDQLELLGDILPFALVEPDQDIAPAPVRCVDPHDQPFLDLAYAAGVRFLVTGDHHLLDLASTVPFAILPPTAFLNHLSAPPES